jgi:hypothetical protein
MQHDVQLVELVKALRCRGSRARVKGLNWPEHSTQQHVLYVQVSAHLSCLQMLWKALEAGYTRFL